MLMLLAAGLGATSFTVGKAIADNMDPVVLTLIRFSLATFFFYPYVKKKYGFEKPTLSSLGRYSLVSFALTSFFILMFVSLRYTSAINTGVIFTLVPGISGVYSMILLNERLGRSRLIALFFAMPGAIWVIFHGDPAKMLALDLNRGDLIFFGACLLMAFYTPLIKLLYRGEPMPVMTFWILATGCGWLLLAAAPRLLIIHWNTILYSTWAGVLYLAIFCTLITFFLSQWSTIRLGPTRVMAYSYLYPPLILFTDWALGHGLPPARTLPGIFLIGLSMVIVQKGAGNGWTGKKRNTN
jgi:drug/metabolite transporter (DMT)-like permease